MEKTLDLLSIGEAMAELSRSPDLAFNVGFAGDTFNTAVYCAKALGSKGNVSYLSRVGTDPLSAAFLQFATHHGLDTTQVHQDSEKNIGIYSVSTDASGERSFHYWREQSAARRLFATNETTPELPRSRITYLSGITLAILPPEARRKLLDQVQRRRDADQSLIAFDSNYRPRLWESKLIAQQVIAQMWAIADIALPSIDDEMALYDEPNEAAVMSRFAQRSWVACAIKRAERGPISLNAAINKQTDFLPAKSVVDTTAAGDSFNGAYLAAFLQDQPEIQCLVAAHTCASRVVGVRGAIES